MKKAVSGITLALILAFPLILILNITSYTFGNPENLFEEDFESYAVGSFPSDKFYARWGGWWVTEEGGNKFLRSESYTGANWDIITIQKFPGNVKIEFLTRHALGNPYLDITNTLEPMPGVFSFAMYVWENQYGIYYHWSNDGINYVSGSSTLGAFTAQPDTWYKVTMTLKGALAKFYVNDLFVFEYDISTVIPFPIENFHLYWSTWGQRDLDNIKVMREITPPLVTATVDILPQSLNLRSKGKYITGYIELPEGYDVNDINVSSIILDDIIPAEPKPTAIGDYDGDGILDLMVKFNRAEVVSYILDNIDIEEKFTTVTLTITGYLNDGTPFQGSDTIKIIYDDRFEMLVAHMLRYEKCMQGF